MPQLDLLVWFPIIITTGFLLIINFNFFVQNIKAFIFIKKINGKFISVIS
jgi:hypothetical protein